MTTDTYDPGASSYDACVGKQVAVNHHQCDWVA